MVELLSELVVELDTMRRRGPGRPIVYDTSVPRT
jgi:hypothetical protein